MFSTPAKVTKEKKWGGKLKAVFLTELLGFIHVWEKHLCFLGTTEIVILEVVLSEEKLSTQISNVFFFQ